MVVRINQNKDIQNVELELYPQDLATILLECWDAEYRYSATGQHVAGYFDIMCDPLDEGSFNLYGKLVVFNQMNIKFYIRTISPTDKWYNAFLKEYDEYLWEKPLRYKLTGEFFNDLLESCGVYRKLPEEVEYAVVDFVAVLKGEFSPRNNWKAGKETFK